ncbi:zinc finger protein 512B isoform X2 [Pseudoliparis swirei]|nr:zinc finger protein 512B isoform X2 [Pseudoliparis swirei]
MESPNGPRLGKLSSSGMPRGRTPKHGHPQEPVVRTTAGPENHSRHGPVCDEPAEGRRKGRPKAEVQELRSVPPPVAEKLSHGCPDCAAMFSTKGRLQKHKLWSHPPDGVAMEPRDERAALFKAPVRSNAKKRPMENSPPSPVFFKVKKTHEVSAPSRNGELAHQRSDKKPHGHGQPPLPPPPPPPPPHIHPPPPVQPPSCGTSSDGEGSDSDGDGDSDGDSDGLLASFPDEDPERTRHRRKQKTPKKFTGEQPSISGTFGLKGMTKVEEKLKAGRAKRSEGSGFSEEPQRRPTPSQSSKKDPAATGSGADAQWQRAIHERGEVVCPTCSIVTRKTIHGLKKHMEICQKLQDALKCQQCHKQFRSKAGLNYHAMAEHSTKPSGSERQTGDKQEERERLRRVLKQMGRIKCPSEGCSVHFSSLMGYQYHQKRCGRGPGAEEKPVFLCPRCGKTYQSKAGRDYHTRAEHCPAGAAATNNNNSRDVVTDTNNNKERVVSGESPLLGRKEPSPAEKDWREKAPLGPPRDKDRGGGGGVDKERGGGDKERERVEERAPPPPPPAADQGDDFERTPSGRVRRRSAQVAVFHLQEIAEDELAKDWGTKRRIKDDLVPDSKRLNYTRPGLPNFSQELLESWKNQVKEKGFICCINQNCEAVYSSVSGLKAHLANCSQGGGELGKYTCLICQKDFSSESGVKYHISKTHSQNWFRAAAPSQVASSAKSKAPESDGVKGEVRNGAATGKKRGRKPKERPPVAAAAPPLQHTQTEASPAAGTRDSTPSRSPTRTPEPTPADQTGQPVRRSKPPRPPQSE